MIVNNKQITIVDSFTLAEYIVANIKNTSHLKIQKLLYYIQGFHLAYFDKPIIKDDFQAWLHGPVSRVLFDRLKGKSLLHTELNYTKKENEEDIKNRIQILSSEQIDLIKQVLSAYGDLTGLELENLTHSEAPWVKARTGYSLSDRCEVVIPNEDMRSFFITKLYT